MIQPTKIATFGKYFTDGYTWNGGGSNPYLTSIQLTPSVEAGYTIGVNDVALVAVSNGIYPTASGWSKIVDNANIDIWMKQHSGGADTFVSYWEHSGGGSSLFYGGIAGMVLRTPYGSSGLVYANNENLYTVNPASSTMTRPAVSRSSFEDSDFYYRIDADYISEDYGSYYSGYYYYSDTFGVQYGSTYSANTYEFLSSGSCSIGLSVFNSSNLSGQALTYNPATYPGGNVNFSKSTLWIRGWNQTSQGVML